MKDENEGRLIAMNSYEGELTDDRMFCVKAPIVLGLKEEAQEQELRSNFIIS